jgi:3-hydroxybutyryl-CoA dehydrogenase
MIFENLNSRIMKFFSVIGAGTMGKGITQVFAENGFSVNLVDVSSGQLEKAMKSIEKNLDRQIEKGKITLDEKKGSLERVSLHTDISSGVKEAELIVEAATENTALKLQIFRQLDEAAPAHCILASNTSSISITKIAAVTKREGQVIGMHFMNPVPVMKLVEIIEGYATKNEITQSIVELTTQLKKTPCVVKDYPGFIANRILMPMINEAIYSLHEGVAGVEEIDTIMKLGMAHPMGPLELADFIGLDVCHSILNVLYTEFGNFKYAPCPLLTNMVNAGYLGVKTSEGFYKYTPGNKELVLSSRFKK